MNSFDSYSRSQLTDKTWLLFIIMLNPSTTIGKGKKKGENMSPCLGRIALV